MRDKIRDDTVVSFDKICLGFEAAFISLILKCTTSKRSRVARVYLWGCRRVPRWVVHVVECGMHLRITQQS